MLADNIMFLRKNYPALYQELKKNEDEAKDSSIFLEETKNKCQTLKVIKEGKSLYLHSKYDPLREAEAIISQLEERETIDENTHFIFYGLGLGYHIDVLLKKYPDLTFSLYEPSLEALQVFLTCKNIKEYKEKNIFSIQSQTESLDEFFVKILNENKKRIVIVDLPSYKNAFKEEHTRFFTRFLEIIKGKKLNLGVDLAFQQRWIFNSVVNFKKVLTTPNILMQDGAFFEDKTAILVASGPSLEDEIENLRIIKEKGLAYIFAAGSALRVLLHNNLLPDAVTTYDPGEGNYRVFTEIAKYEEAKNVPIIFGSSVIFEILNIYPGSQYHMITSQDTVANYFLRDKNDKEIPKVNDAPTIAVVTMEMLNKLKFSTIILVGQNLAYKNDQYYAEGMGRQKNINNQNKQNFLKTKDVLGNEIFTDESFNSMRLQMEQYIKQSDFFVINTTKGGAHIEGAKFIPMNTLLEEKLTTQIVQKNIFKTIDNLKNYDKVYLGKKAKEMAKAYEKYQYIVQKIKEYLSKIKELLKNINIKQAKIMYEKLDDLLRELENNDFFKVIVLPTNRIAYEFLANDVQRIKVEKNELKRTKELVKKVESFINQICIDNDSNQTIINILLESENAYVKQ